MASSMSLKRLVSTSLQRLVRPASISPPSSRFFHTNNADRRSGLSIFGHRNNFFSANGSGSGSGSLFQAPPRTYLGQSTVFTRGFAIGFEKRNLRDHKRRLLAEKYEMRRKLYKALCGDVNLPIELREKNRYKLSKLPRNSAFGRLRNRCIFTGRPRAVYRKFRISRIVFRELASKGSLMGVKKASW